MGKNYLLIMFILFLCSCSSSKEANITEREDFLSLISNLEKSIVDIDTALFKSLVIPSVLDKKIYTLLKKENKINPEFKNLFPPATKDYTLQRLKFLKKNYANFGIDFDSLTYKTETSSIVKVPKVGQVKFYEVIAASTKENKAHLVLGMIQVDNIFYLAGPLLFISEVEYAFYELKQKLMLKPDHSGNLTFRGSFKLLRPNMTTDQTFQCAREYYRGGFEEIQPSDSLGYSLQGNGIFTISDYAGKQTAKLGRIEYDFGYTIMGDRVDFFYSNLRHSQGESTFMSLGLLREPVLDKSIDKETYQTILEKVESEIKSRLEFSHSLFNDCAEHLY